MTRTRPENSSSDGEAERSRSGPEPAQPERRGGWLKAVGVTALIQVLGVLLLPLIAIPLLTLGIAVLVIFNTPAAIVLFLAAAGAALWFTLRWLRAEAEKDREYDLSD